MPQFTTPYAPSRMREQNNTIADLIQRGGAQQAEGIRRGGEISAQMYGNLGQIASGAFQEYQQRKAQLAQEKAMAPLRQAQTMRAQGEVRQMQQQDRMSDVMANKASFEAAGNPAMDDEALISNLRQNGLDQFVPEVMKDLAETRKAKEAHVEQTRYTIASVLDRTRKYLGTPLQGDALRMAAQTLKESGVAGVDDVSGQLMEAPADKVKLVFDNLIGQSPRYLEERTKGQKVVGKDQALVGPDGTAIYTAPNEPKPESRSIDVQAAEALAKGDMAAYERLKQVKKDMGQADDRPREKPSMTPTMEANVVNRLNTQWQTAVKPASELSRQVKLMDAGLAAAKRGDLAQGAQAVLVTFQKILDPTSVVRESEYMRSAAGQALIDRISGYAELLAKGGAGVPLGQLEKFAELAREAARAQVQNLPSQKKRIGAIAQRYGIPEELIFEDYDVAKTFDPPSAPSALPSPSPAKKKPRFVNGAWER